MKHRRLAMVAAATAVTAACSSKDAADPAADAGLGDTVECAGDASPFPVDMYSVDLLKVGQAGALSFKLLSSTPAPPEQGLDTFVVVVTHADGSSFTGSLVIPSQGMWMPLHNHGPTIQPTIAFDPAQNAFVLSNMDFFMLGLWRVQLEAFETPDPEAGADATAPTVPTDTATFYFCI